MERSGLIFKHFYLKVVEIVFCQILPYKKWWKKSFPMDCRPLIKGRIANFGIFADIFDFLRFG